LPQLTLPLRASTAATHREQVRNADAIGITEAEMSEWRDALLQFDPPLVGAHTADVGFVASVWRLFLAAGVRS